MNGGYVRLYRQVLDSAVFQDGELLRLYMLLLLRAAFKEQHVSMKVGRGSTIVKLEPGQAIVGRKATAKELEWPPSTFRDRLLKLEKMGLITCQPDTHWTIVSVVNYGENQSGEGEGTTGNRQATDTQPTGNRHPTDTNKNSKNSKTSKKDKNSNPSAVAEDESLSTFTVKGGEWELMKSFFNQLQQEFPTIDIVKTCLDLKEWVAEDPERLCPASKMKSRLRYWMKKSNHVRQQRRKTAYELGLTIQQQAAARHAREAAEAAAKKANPNPLKETTEQKSEAQKRRSADSAADAVPPFADSAASERPQASPKKLLTWRLEMLKGLAADASGDDLKAIQRDIAKYEKEYAELVLQEAGVEIGV